jgi:peptide/nickel transport system substrate-binding protein
MLRTGEADIMIAVPPHQAKAIEADPNTKMVVSPSFQNVGIGINMRAPHGQLRDPKVRQAFNYAVDKKTIIEKVMFGYAQQQVAPCHVDVIGCRIDREAYPYDPKKAKALLEEARFDFGRTYKIFAQAGGRVPQSKEVMEAVAFYLNQVGIKTDVQFLEFAAWLATFGGKKFDDHDLFYFNWTDYNNDPMGRLPRGITKDGVYSWADYPDLDPLIAQANAIPDPAKREAHLKGIFTRLYDDPPWIILWSNNNTDAARANVVWKPRKNVSWPVFHELSKN